MGLKNHKKDDFFSGDMHIRGHINENIWSSVSSRIYDLWAMGVIRQVQFTKLIKAGGRQREFNFRQNQGPERLICRVDTPDDQNGRYELEFKQEPVGWAWCVKVIPDWLMAVIPQITLAIKEPV